MKEGGGLRTKTALRNLSIPTWLQKENDFYNFQRVLRQRRNGNADGTTATTKYKEKPVMQKLNSATITPLSYNS